jgi:tetratricopeptide (TPR) repeat protein
VTGAYMLSMKLMNIDELTKTAKIVDGKKQIDINVNLNENSEEHIKYYRDIEKYMMVNCNTLKEKIATNDKISEKSFSDNKKALAFYSSGLKQSKKENFEKAIRFYKKSLNEDPNFAFAWDNLGISYRKVNQYQNAIDAYNKSLEIDPKGVMPLQNIAVVYQYMKEFDKAIESYKKLALIDKNNPEIFYGIGNIYANDLKEYELGLENMCKAYNLYVTQKSPYRTDAENIINKIYGEMKKADKVEKFNEILKNNNISQN